jgi:hypothetical protein
VNKVQPTVAVACFALAAVILVFADGARRIYAGGFFVVLGIVMLVNARRRGRGEDKL